MHGTTIPAASNSQKTKRKMKRNTDRQTDRQTDILQIKVFLHFYSRSILENFTSHQLHKIMAAMKTKKKKTKEMKPKKFHLNK